MLLQIGTNMFLWYRMILWKYKSVTSGQYKVCKKSIGHLFGLSLNCFTSIFYAKYTELTAPSLSPSSPFPPPFLPLNKKLLRPTSSHALQGAGVWQ